MKTVILFVAISIITLTAQWNNGGGNPQKNGLSNLNGPAADTILWSVQTGSLIGFPVYIDGNKIITMKFLSTTNAPVVCYDMETGLLLWEKDVTGVSGRSLPLGIRDGQVYVMRLTESLHDTLYALDEDEGTILWTADVTIDAYITTSLSFAPNGDLFVEGYFNMYRINHETGQKMWETNIVPFVLGTAEMAVNGNTGYLVEQIGGVAYIQAIDIETGQKKYSHTINDTHPGGAIPESALMAGWGGLVFVHKQEDNITALRDNGTAFELLWEKEITGNSPFSLMCIGSDSSIYIPSDGRVLRLNYETGEAVDSSNVIGNPVLFQMRASASANGFIYVTSGEDSVYAFTPDLKLLWSDYVPAVNTSGAAIGIKGIAVAGSNMLRVYASENISSAGDQVQPVYFSLEQNYPNPFNPETNIIYRVPDLSHITLKVFDILGNEIETLVNEEKPKGTYEVKWNASGYPSGVYFYQLRSGDNVETKKLMLIR